MLTRCYFEARLEIIHDVECSDMVVLRDFIFLFRPSFILGNIYSYSASNTCVVLTSCAPLLLQGDSRRELKAINAVLRAARQGDEAVHCADALQFYFMLRQICSLLHYYAHLEAFQDVNCPNSIVLKDFYLPSQTTRYICFLIVSNTFAVFTTCSPTLL